MTADASARPSGVVAADAVPAWAPGVRLREDRARDRWVVLAPERVVVPDPVCLDVLRLIDGRTPVADLVAELCSRYHAPAAHVTRDVVDLLLAFHERAWLVWR